MKRHIENTRGRLADLGAMAAQTEADEKKILGNALKQREALLVQIERMRPGVEAAPEASQKRYTDAVAEAARLEIIIAKARKALRI
jgi:hypothetical protein